MNIMNKKIYPLVGEIFRFKGTSVQITSELQLLYLNLV